MLYFKESSVDPMEQQNLMQAFMLARTGDVDKALEVPGIEWVRGAATSHSAYKKIITESTMVTFEINAALRSQLTRISKEFTKGATLQTVGIDDYTIRSVIFRTVHGKEYVSLSMGRFMYFLKRGMSGFSDLLGKFLCERPEYQDIFAAFPRSFNKKYEIKVVDNFPGVHKLQTAHIVTSDYNYTRVLSIPGIKTVRIGSLDMAYDVPEVLVDYSSAVHAANAEVKGKNQGFRVNKIGQAYTRLPFMGVDFVLVADKHQLDAISNIGEGLTGQFRNAFKECIAKVK